VTQLQDGRLVMMLDVEKILAETTHYDDSHLFTSLKPLPQKNRTVFFADDSTVARKQIARTLEALQINHISANDGAAAWESLQRIAAQAEANHVPVTDLIQIILTDVEMPEMDGYVLTKKIKSDARFNGIPVIMHSSLSSSANQKLGMAVGVDDYLPKFEPEKLAEVISRILG